MSKLQKLKRELNYQEHVPRCATCIHYRQEQILQDSNPNGYWHWWCDKHSFNIKTHACCDDWESKKGETLG